MEAGDTDEDTITTAKRVVAEMESKTFTCTTNEDAAAITAQLNALAQTKVDVKKKFHTLMMNNVMKNLAEPKEKWMSLVSQSEESLQSAKDKLRTARHAVEDQKTEMTQLNSVVAEGLAMYQQNIKDLNEKIKVFENKRQELQQLKDEVLDLENEDDEALNKDIQAELEKTAEKIKDCHKELIQMSYKAMRMQLHISQAENDLQLLNRRLDEDAELTDDQRLSMMQKNISDIEQLSGVTCKNINANTIVVEFPPRPAIVQHGGHESDSSGSRDDLVLKITLTLKDNVMGYQHLSAIKSNLNSFDLEDVQKDFKGKPVSCLPQVITLIKRRWLSHLPLLSEIKWLQDRFVIDWIQQENTLRAIVGKCGGIVCSLDIPQGYPHQGQVALANIMGAPDDVVLESIKPQTGSTLTDWVQLLEYRFGKP